MFFKIIQKTSLTPTVDGTDGEVEVDYLGKSAHFLQFFLVCSLDTDENLKFILGTIFD